MKDIESFLGETPHPRFLIIRLKPIGDTVLLSPVLRALRRRFPGAVIDVVVFPFVEDVIRHNPHVDTVHVVERTIPGKLRFYLRSLFRRYDVVIDFINNPTSAMIALLTPSRTIIGNRTKRSFFYDYRLVNHDARYSCIRSLHKLEPLGITDVGDCLPELHPGADDLDRAAAYFDSLGLDGHCIGLFASAKYPSKQWPALHFAELGRMIAEHLSANVLFLFGLGDGESYAAVRRLTDGVPGIFLHTPDTTLGELCALISRLSFMVTGDTGPKHIATALDIPTLTLFGASNEKVWNPPDRRRFPVIRKELPCAPCNRNRCPRGTYACMRGLPPEEVFTVLETALAENGVTGERVVE